MSACRQQRRQVDQPDPELGGAGRLQVRVVGDARRCRTPTAAAANSCPIRPSPTTPTVLSAISTPVNWLRFHSPARSEASAAGTFRATASSSATACSAAVTMFDCGALTTSTPRAVAAGTSTLSRPMPARATTLSSRSAAASASASILVAVRISTASASASAGSRADRSAPSTCRISNSAASTSIADWASCSAISTTGRLTTGRSGWATAAAPLDGWRCSWRAPAAAGAEPMVSAPAGDPAVSRDTARLTEPPGPSPRAAVHGKRPRPDGPGRLGAARSGAAPGGLSGRPAARSRPATSARSSAGAAAPRAGRARRARAWTGPATS